MKEKEKVGESEVHSMCGSDYMLP